MIELFTNDKKTRHFIRCRASDMAEFNTPAHSSRANASKLRDRLERLAYSWDRAWMGFSKSDTKRHMDKGWPEGAERLRDLADDLMADVPQATSIRRKQRWGDDGDEIDMQRVYSGALDKAWRGPRRVRRTAPKVITVAGSFGGHCGLTSEQMFWIGATAVVICDKLEEAGYQVELLATNLNYHGGNANRGSENWSTSIVEVKTASEPLSVEAAACVFCHSGFYRTAGINIDATAPWHVDAHWGRPRSDKRDVVAAYEAAVKLGAAEEVPTVILDAATTKEQAKKVVADFIARLDSDLAAH